MYETQIFKEAQEVTHNLSDVLHSLFRLLPPKTEISIQLENRLICALTCIENKIELAPRKASNPDVEVVFFPESIRRLRDKNPTSMAQLSKEIFSLWSAGIL